MENLSKKIYSILANLASEMDSAGISFNLERPKDAKNGDFATNIALVLFQKEHSILRKSAKSDVSGKSYDFKNPTELAGEIVKILNTKYDALNIHFDRIEAVKPGFINFYLSGKYLQSQVQNIMEKGDDYGSSDLGKGKKISVEFVSANPTGPLHIGNARGGPLGDTIANVLQKAGYEVTREYLHNDVGGQIDRLGEAIYFELNPERKSEKYEVTYQGEYIRELAQNVEEALYEDEDLSESEFIEKAGKAAVKIMLEDILKDCKTMGINFDVIKKESDLRHQVAKTLDKIKQNLKEKDGALWFAPNDEFLKDRETVVKKSDGQYTYFASDIAYHDEKFENNAIVIDVLGANHSGHVPRLQAAIKSLGFDTNNFKPVLYQWVRLKKGKETIKMSKRAGNFVTAREVLGEVGKDAFRFFLLTPRPQTFMDFDLELAKKAASENPVFYVQYAYSRICSIFSKYKTSKGANKISNEPDLSLLKNLQEITLIRHLIKFPYLVEETAKNLEVNVFTTYALELANLFHKYYETNQVISKDEKLTQSRLLFLKATQITLKNTLDLLGVDSLEKM